MKRRGKAILAGVTAAATMGGGLLLIGGNAQADENITVRSGDFVQSLSDTRAHGTVTVGDNGVGVVTTDATSEAKAAEYWAYSVNLADVGTPTLDWIGTDAKPGKQLLVDFDNNGTTDGILVGEDVYNGNWWVSSSAQQFVKDNAPSNSGGYGSQWNGTLAQWDNKFPNAKVKAVGFSLGSGIKGSGIITKMTVGNTNFTFAGKLPATVVSPVSVAPTNLKVTTTDTGSAKLTWDAAANAKGYRIYRSDLDENVGASLDTSATVQGLKPNTTYKFSVAGYGADGNVGPKSTEATGKTTKFPLPAPKNLKCKATSSTAMLCTADKVEGANRYSWYANVGTSPKIVAHGSSDAPSYNIVGLTRHGSIQVRVAADNDTQGPGPASSLISVKLK